jgi:long-chain fatty acid transport protein
MKLLSLGSALSCTTILFSMTVQAGGLYIREFGQPTQGMAGAGAQVMIEDASIAFQNPAGVFKLEGDSEWMVTGVALFSQVNFDPDDSTTIEGDDGGEAGGFAAGAAVFHTRKLSDDWGMTFSLNSISGNALDYDDDFVGRYEGGNVKLLTISFLPSIAYKINEQFSVSLGAPITYGNLELEAAVPPLLGPATPDRDGKAKIQDGDDYDVTLSASALWQVTEDFRLGAAYLGENTLDFSSSLKVTLPGAGSGTTIDNIGSNVKIKFPQTFVTSAGWQYSDKLTLSTRLAWEDWSVLESIPVSTSGPGGAIPVNWQDVWSLALGMRYQVAPRWAYYTGISYDSDPATDKDRLALLPADEQWRLAGGFTYTLSDKRTFGVAITYVDLGEAALDRNGDVGSFSGKYDKNSIWFLGVNYAWH